MQRAVATVVGAAFRLMLLAQQATAAVRTLKQLTLNDFKGETISTSYYISGDEYKDSGRFLDVTPPGKNDNIITFKMIGAPGRTMNIYVEGDTQKGTSSFRVKLSETLNRNAFSYKQLELFDLVMKVANQPPK